MPKQLFVKGVSGNPKGRPRGTRNKSLLIRDKLIDALETDAIKVVKAIVKKALEGDMQAAKIIMDRLIPQQKAVIGGEEGMRQPVVNITIGTLNDDEKNQNNNTIDVTPTITPTTKDNAKH